MKKVNRTNVFIIIIFALSLIIFLLIFMINFKGNSILSEERIPVGLIIGNSSGFNLTEGFMDFGMITLGTSSNRKINISNDKSFGVVAGLEIRGEIKNFLIFNSSINIPSGESRSILIKTIRPTLNEPYGYYSGELIIKIKRDIYKRD